MCEYPETPVANLVFLAKTVSLLFYTLFMKKIKLELIKKGLNVLATGDFKRLSFENAAYFVAGALFMTRCLLGLRAQSSHYDT